MSNPIPKGELVEGDVVALMDPRFINALVIQSALEKSGKKYVAMTMDRIEKHDSLTYENGRTEQNAILLYFQKTKKPLKLNTTNLQTIARMHGTIGKGWHGKKVAVGIKTEYRPDIKAHGPCVRILNIDPVTGRSPDAF